MLCSSSVSSSTKELALELYANQYPSSYDIDDDDVTKLWQNKTHAFQISFLLKTCSDSPIRDFHWILIFFLARLIEDCSGLLYEMSAIDGFHHKANKAIIIGLKI